MCRHILQITEMREKKTNEISSSKIPQMIGVWFLLSWKQHTRRKYLTAKLPVIKCNQRFTCGVAHFYLIHHSISFIGFSHTENRNNSWMHFHVQAVEKLQCKIGQTKANGLLSTQFSSVFFLNEDCITCVHNNIYFAMLLRDDLRWVVQISCGATFISTRLLLSSFTGFPCSPNKKKWCLDTKLRDRVHFCDMCLVICYPSHCDANHKTDKTEQAASIVLSHSRRVWFVESNHLTNCIHWRARSG